MNNSKIFNKNHYYLTLFWFPAMFIAIGLISLSYNQPKAFGAENCDVFVATDGHDSNNGSKNNPLKTTSKALEIANNTSTVCLRGGSYNERIVIEKSGTDTDPFVLKGYPGEEVIINGNNISIGNGGLIHVRAQNNIIIDNLTVRNSQGRGVFIGKKFSPVEILAENITVQNLEVINTNGAAIYVNGGKNITIDSNHTRESLSSGVGIWNSFDVIVSNNSVIDARYLESGNQECITIANTEDFEVMHNEVQATTPERSFVGALGIDAKQGSRFGKIHHNHIHSLYYASAIYLDAWDRRTHDIEIYANRIHNTKRGVSLGSERGGLLENIKIYNNLIYDVGNSGVIAQSASDNGERRNIEIFNNTIVDTNNHQKGVNISHGGAGIYLETDNIFQVAIYNNLVSFTDEERFYGLIQYNQNIDEVEIKADNNLIFGRMVEYQNKINLNKGLMIEENPSFVDAQNKNFALQASSPAINKGKPLNLNVDINNIQRPQAGQIDIGAFEFTGDSELPLCNDTNWQYEDSSCQNYELTRSWQQVGDCSGGVTQPATEIIACGQDTTPESEYAFIDIADYPYFEAINYLAEKEVVQGFDDQTYRPEKPINRAEFVKILIEARFNDFESIKSNYIKSCFVDVPKWEWYVSHICYAQELEIINGYPDGKYRPAKWISLVEALKIIVEAYEIPQGSSGANWYDQYLEPMQTRSYIPSSFTSLNQDVSRGEMAEIIWRVNEDIQEKDTTSF